VYELWFLDSLASMALINFMWEFSVGLMAVLSFAGVVLSYISAASFVVGLVYLVAHFEEISTGLAMKYNDDYNCLTYELMWSWGLNSGEQIQMRQEVFAAPKEENNDNWTPTSTRTCKIDECKSGDTEFLNMPCQVNRFLKPQMWQIMATTDSDRFNTWEAGTGGIETDNDKCPDCELDVLQTPRALRWSTWDAVDNDECTCHDIRDVPNNVRKLTPENVPKFVKPIPLRCPTTYEIMSTLQSSLNSRQISDHLMSVWGDPSDRRLNNGGCSFYEGFEDSKKYCGEDGRDTKWAYGNKTIVSDTNGTEVVIEGSFLGMVGKLSPEQERRTTDVVTDIVIPCSVKPLFFFLPATQAVTLSDYNVNKMQEIAQACVDNPSSCEPTKPEDLLPSYEKCYDDIECESGTCGRIKADAFGACSSSEDECYCCPFPAVVKNVARDYCAGLPNGAECSLDRQCGIPNTGSCTGSVCEQATSRLAAGEECKDNSDCVTNACGRMDELTTFHCCEHGLLRGLVRDFCKELSSGDKCYYNSQCTDRLCDKNECKSKKTAGKECNADGDCASGHCGQFVEGPYYVCCPGGTTDGGSSCDDLVDGHPFSFNKQCHSSFCARIDDFNAVCKPKLPTYGDCSEFPDKDVACLSNNCESFQGYDHKICCPNKDWYLSCDYAVDCTKYCGALSAGEACRDDQACDSGMCINNICQEKFATFTKCNDDSQCNSNLCASFYGYGHDQKVCCPNEEFYRGFYNVYCGGLVENERCFDDDACQSENCVGNTCICPEKRGEGQECTEKSQCCNAECGIYNNNEAQQCCPSYAGRAYFWFYWYCDNLETGATCYKDFQCRGGNCIRLAGYGYCE